MQHDTALLSDLQRAIHKVEARQEKLCGDEVAAEKLRFGCALIDDHMKGGLVLNSLHEVRCSLTKDIACASALIYGLLCHPMNDKRKILWITDPATGHDSGKPNPDGLSQFGIDPTRFIFVRPTNLKDAIWAAGEASALGGLSAVVIHIKGHPNSFDLSVSRKLMLRAQLSHTPVFILRQAGEEEASSALTRWHVKPEPSIPDITFKQGVGAMRLTLTLERNRNGQTGKWQIAWNPKMRSFENAAKPAKPTDTGLPLHPPSNRHDHAQAMGQIVAFDRAS